MTIYNVAAFAGCSILSAWLIQPRMSGRWLVFVLALLVALITLLAWRSWRVTYGPPNLGDWINSFIVVTLWIAVSPLAFRFWRFRQERLRSRDPWAEFDRQVYRAVQPLSRILANQPANVAKAEWIQSIMATRQSSLDALVALRSPTEEWAEVRDSYVSLLQDDFETENPTRDLEFRAKAAAIAVRVRALRVADGRDPGRV